MRCAASLVAASALDARLDSARHTSCGFIVDLPCPSSSQHRRDMGNECCEAWSLTSLWCNTAFEAGSAGGQELSTLTLRLFLSHQASDGRVLFRSQTCGVAAVLAGHANPCVTWLYCGIQHQPSLSTRSKCQARDLPSPASHESNLQKTAWNCLAAALQQTTICSVDRCGHVVYQCKW